MGTESEQFPPLQELCVHRWLIEGNEESQHIERCKLCGITKVVAHTKKTFQQQGRFTGKSRAEFDQRAQSRQRAAITREVLNLKMQGFTNSRIADELGISNTNLDEYPKRFIDTLEIAAPDERIALHRAVRIAVATERLAVPSFLTDNVPLFEELDRFILDQYGDGLAVDTIARSLKKETPYVSVKCKEILQITGAMTSLGLAAWLGREDFQKRHSFQE